MKTAVLLIGITVAHMAVAKAQQWSGRYTTYIGGKATITEKWTVSSDRGTGIKSEAEITAGSLVSRVVTETSSAGLARFTSKTEGGPSITAVFGTSSVKIQTNDLQTRELQTKATVILSNVVWHHYIHLLRQYDLEKAGRQDFVAFLPDSARDVTVTVERREDRKFGAGGRQAVTRVYSIVLANRVGVDVWTDENQIPLLISIPSQGVKVVSDGMEWLGEAALSAPAEREEFKSEEVVFENNGIKLAGTLTVPRKGSGPWPAVVMISGSGPQDRDENPGGFSLFKAIGDTLSFDGMAVLRHDDRGFGKSSSPSKPTTYMDLINDTKAAVEYVRGRKEIDPNRVVLVGHSEGAETAAIIASEDKRIAAIALLAGYAVPLNQLAYEQGLYEAALKGVVTPGRASMSDEINKVLGLIDEARTGKPDVSLNDSHEYFRQHATLDPLQTITRVRCPILILQGERDLNVAPHHAIALAIAAAQTNSHVSVRIFPDLSHTFTPSPLDKSVGYDKLSEVSKEFLRSLNEWLKAALLK